MEFMRHTRMPGTRESTSAAPPPTVPALAAAAGAVDSSAVHTRKFGTGGLCAVSGPFCEALESSVL